MLQAKLYLENGHTETHTVENSTEARSFLTQSGVLAVELVRDGISKRYYGPLELRRKRLNYSPSGVLF